MPERILTSLAEYEHALATTGQVLLFKHSPTCPVSASAHAAYDAWRRATPAAETLFVDVIAARPVARGIAELCGTRHESPQAILFVAGRAVWNASHDAITEHALAAAWHAASTPRELVLASTSAFRRALLERLGVPFRAVAPDLDEEPFKRQGLAPRALAETLALAKARCVARTLPDALVIGSDQVCALGDARFGKPNDPATAIAQLKALRGRTHTLWTAVALVAGERVTTHVDESRLTMRALADEALVRYVERDQPLGCAGSYRIEGAGIALFERVESADWNAIVGLPLLWLCGRLALASSAGAPGADPGA